MAPLNLGYLTAQIYSGANISSDVVGERGLEPPCLAALAPKASASANFATRPGGMRLPDYFMQSFGKKLVSRLHILSLTIL